jgi:hypothetical protein
MTTTLCVGAAIALVLATRGRGRGWWIGYSLLSAAALMSHYIAAGFLAAAGLWALIAHRERWRSVILAQAGPAVAVAIWLPGLIEQVGNSSDELRRLAIDNPLSLDTVTDIVARGMVGHPLVHLDRVPGSVGLGLALAGMVVALVFGSVRLASLVRDPERTSPTSEQALVGILAAAAPVLAIVVSAQPNQSILIPRNLIVSVPAGLIVVAVLLARPPRLAAAASTALVLAGLTIGTIAEVTHEQRPNARAAAQAVDERWRPADRIIELLLIGAKGPLGRDVAINLPAKQDATLEVLGSVGQSVYSERAGRQPGNVFVVGYRLRGASQPLFFSPPPAWSARYRPVWTESWPGIVDTVVTEYSPTSSKSYR